MFNFRAFLVSLIIFLITLTFSFKIKTYSHFLEYDSGVGIVYHFPPSDQPKAGEETSIELTFVNTDKDYDPLDISSCECVGSIREFDIELYRENLYISSEKSNKSTLKYTFPKAGVYTVHVEGKSRDESFLPFKLKYSVRVESADFVPANQKNSGNEQNLNFGRSEIALFSVAGLLALVPLSVGFYLKTKNEKSTKK